MLSKICYVKTERWLPKGKNKFCTSHGKHVVARRTLIVAQFESAIWEKWLNDGSALTLIVDGVDEGKQLIGNFLEWLLTYLAKTFLWLDRSLFWCVVHSIGRKALAIP